MLKSQIVKWLPALFVMGIIFWLSAQPSEELPNFDWADRLVKKSGHILGYAILAISYSRPLGVRKRGTWLAWIMSILYAVSDELHQSFVPGRNPSVWDVLIFDNIGALLGLWIYELWRKQKRSD